MGACSSLTSKLRTSYGFCGFRSLANKPRTSCQLAFTVQQSSYNSMGGGVSSEALPKELEGKDVYTLDEIKAAFGDKFDEAKAEEALKGIETRDAISRQTVEAALGLGSGGEESQGAAAAADAGTAAAQSAGESATESVAPPAAPAVRRGWRFCMPRERWGWTII